jgi:hypothetical protein
MLGELENKTLKTLNTKMFNNYGNRNSNDNSNAKSYLDETQLYLVELYRKYRDPGSVDRLHAIQKDVDTIQIEMKDNVKKMMSNIDDASVYLIKY